MADAPTPPPGKRSTRPWRVYFERTAAAIFVVSGARRLRYANPAWEKLTGQPLARLRGTKFSSTRKSASPLWKTLAPPPEVWEGQPTRVRRPAPAAATGPPWWDVTFVPLPGAGRPVGVIGMITVVGRAAKSGPVYKVPAVLGELRQSHAAAYSFDLLDGPAPGTQRLLTQARLAAQTTAPVWLVGEPGTGKETLARVIHHNGATREGAFVGLDCHGVQPYLVESLLTGRGGLTGSGHVGTLYLKDPGALPRDLQERVAAPFAKPGGTRLICGSTAPADEEARSGRLIPLFHTALSVLELRLLPLRERFDDLPRLVDRLLDRIPSAFKGKARVADEAWPVLRSYPWPGNVRELGAVLAAAVRKAGDGGVVGVDQLPRVIRESHALSLAPPMRPAPGWTLDGVLEAVERRLIELALRKSGNSQTDAAERLGVFRARLARRIEALGIPTPARPPRPRPGKDDASGEA